MIRVLTLVLMFFAAPLWARPVAVTSGEHDGFTRIVLNFGETVDWQFGRTDDGYVFRKSGSPAEYDLSGIFKPIGKSRLAAVSTAAQTGDLNIDFACACHAIPFEFRPGIIVIDLRDGPPPKGSSFENPLVLATDQVSAPPPETEQTALAGPSYDWAATMMERFADPNATPKAADLSPNPSSDPALEPLRDQLLRQLSRGAAEGVVDLELPRKAGTAEKKPGIEEARVSLGEMPNVTIKTGPSSSESLGEVGAQCAAADDLDIDSWGSAETPIADQFSAAYSGVLGEFDRPDPTAVLRAARFLVYIGFGVEANQMISTFGPDMEQAPMLRSMAKLMDDQNDPEGVFKGQVSCDTPAALWAFLADPKLTPGDKINQKAIILGFSNLPAHLRRLLGTRIAEKFLMLQDPASAESIRNAVLRAGGEGSAETAMVEAKIEMAHGDPAAAQAHLEAAYADSGVAKLSALIGMVDSLVAQGLPIDPKIAEELAALQNEVKGSAEAEALKTALSLAQASSGDLAAAFDGADGNAELLKKIWNIMASLGTDSDILAFGVVESDRLPSNLEIETATVFARRLLDLGLPDAAMSWIETYPKIDALTRAKVHLDRQDGRAALAAAQEIEGEDAMRIVAQAQQLLGDNLAAAQAFAALGDAPAKDFAFAKAGKWDELRQQASDTWTPALTAMDPPKQNTSPPLGPLAAGQELIANSAQTRAALNDLLAKIPAASP